MINEDEDGLPFLSDWYFSPKDSVKHNLKNLAWIQEECKKVTGHCSPLHPILPGTVPSLLFCGWNNNLKTQVFPQLFTDAFEIQLPTVDREETEKASPLGFTAGKSALTGGPHYLWSFILKGSNHGLKKPVDVTLKIDNLCIDKSYPEHCAHVKRGGSFKLQLH